MPRFVWLQYDQESHTWLNLHCFGNIPLLKPTSWSHRHSSWDPQGWCRGFLKSKFCCFLAKTFQLPARDTVAGVAVRKLEISKINFISGVTAILEKDKPFVKGKKKATSRCSPGWGSCCHPWRCWGTRSTSDRCRHRGESTWVLLLGGSQCPAWCKKRGRPSTPVVEWRWTIFRSRHC